MTVCGSLLLCSYPVICWPRLKTEQVTVSDLSPYMVQWPEWNGGDGEKKLQSLVLFFLNTCFCRKQSVCFGWLKDWSFKRRLQEKRHPFATELFPGWKGHAGVWRTPTPLPSLHLIKGVVQPTVTAFRREIRLVPSEAFKSQDCFSSLWFYSQYLAVSNPSAFTTCSCCASAIPTRTPWTQ